MEEGPNLPAKSGSLTPSSFIFAPPANGQNVWVRLEDGIEDRGDFFHIGGGINLPEPATADGCLGSINTR